MLSEDGGGGGVVVVGGGFLGFINLMNIQNNVGEGK